MKPDNTISISRIELMQILDALDWAQINLRDHGDNCFLHSDNSLMPKEGESNSCQCGLDSLVDYIGDTIMNIHYHLEKGEVGELPKRTPKAYHDPVLEEPDLTASGEHYADVWHEGSRGYYHAKLLRKLTPEEVEFSCCPIND